MRKAYLKILTRKLCMFRHGVNGLPAYRLLAVFLLILLFSVNSQAQSYGVENVSFTVLRENVIVVNYDLLGANRRYVVDVSLKRKNLPGFSYTPTQAMGDIGKGRFAGRNKKIVWSLDNEDPASFYIDPFVEDYYFEVTARKKSGFGWFLFPAITGGIVWLVLQNADM
ncbi:MAG: hypothetical protein ACOCU3_01135 [bacterium]